MSPTEHSRLLDGPVQNGRPSYTHKFKKFITGEGQPSWLRSLRFFLLGSWFNVLLVFVPLCMVAHHSNWSAGLRFGFSFVAIIPLAKLLGEATEQLSMECGQTLGGLLNASFGNAVEIIVGIAALTQGQLRIVQTSMLGSILSNLLLVLGMSFFAGGVKFSESSFQQTAAQTSSSLMTLACITLVIPAAYNSAQTPGGPVPPKGSFFPGDGFLNDVVSGAVDGATGYDATESGILTISRGTSIMLLIVYAAYLYFQLGSHAELFIAEGDEEEAEEAKMSMVSASLCLLAVTVVTSFCADYLVASIEEFAETYDIPKPFIGIILLPLVANAAEHVTSVWMAVKGKTELTIGISVGSSIQIAVFVIPLLIITGWIIGQDLTLYFANFETICLFVSVMLVNLLIQDGKSNYMEGLMLVTLYMVIAIAFWVS